MLRSLALGASGGPGLMLAASIGVVFVAVACLAYTPCLERAADWWDILRKFGSSGPDAASNPRADRRDVAQPTVGTAEGEATFPRGPGGGGGKCPTGWERHHVVPTEILDKHLPADIANHPLVRGVKGAPNRWCLPKSLHDEVHEGPGGGRYNQRWKEELDRVRIGGRRVTPEDVLQIRDRLLDEFGLRGFMP